MKKYCRVVSASSSTASIGAGGIGVKVGIPHHPIWLLIVAGHVCVAICKPFDIDEGLKRTGDWYIKTGRIRLSNPCSTAQPGRKAART